MLSLPDSGARYMYRRAHNQFDACILYSGPRVEPRRRPLLASAAGIA